MADAVAQIEEGMKHHNFRVTLDDNDSLLESLLAIGQYNSFDPNFVYHALTLTVINQVIESIEIGREGSPVLYLHFRRDLDDEIVASIGYIMKGAAADEVDWGDSTDEEAILRAWWD